MGESKVAIIGGGGFVGSKLGDRFVNKNIFFRKYDIEKRNDVDILSLDIEEIDTLDQLEDAQRAQRAHHQHHSALRALLRAARAVPLDQVDQSKGRHGHGVHEETL